MNSTWKIHFFVCRFIVFPQLLYEHYFKESSSIAPSVYSDKIQNKNANESKLLDFITAQVSILIQCSFIKSIKYCLLEAQQPQHKQ